MCSGHQSFEQLGGNKKNPNSNLSVKWYGKGKEIFFASGYYQKKNCLCPCKSTFQNFKKFKSLSTNQTNLQSKCVVFPFSSLGKSPFENHTNAPSILHRKTIKTQSLY